MRPQWLVTLAAVAVSMNSMKPSNAADAKTAPLAGWLSVFPEMTGYQRTFLAPVVTVDKEKKPVAYHQTVKYEWSGGDHRHFEVTLARDPAFKQKYAAGTLRKEAKPPTEVMIGKRTGWLWEFERQVGKLDAVVSRLVVPLAEEKALIVEDKSGRKVILQGMVELLDLAKITAALDAPPRTDFGRRLEDFRALHKGLSVLQALAWVGEPDEGMPPPKARFVYKLPDGSRVILQFEGDQLSTRLTSAQHESKDGKVEELAK